jgi:dipeptidyl aminopeptidase/acylaminoacyl peptidase
MPPNRKPGTRVPLILEIHGGPASAYGRISRPTTSSMPPRLCRALTNPRGSTSYGEHFANLIDKNYPGPTMTT